MDMGIISLRKMLTKSIHKIIKYFLFRWRILRKSTRTKHTIVYNVIKFLYEEYSKIEKKVQEEISNQLLYNNEVYRKQCKFKTD